MLFWPTKGVSCLAVFVQVVTANRAVHMDCAALTRMISTLEDMIDLRNGRLMDVSNMCCHSGFGDA